MKVAIAVHDGNELTAVRLALGDKVELIPVDVGSDGTTNIDEVIKKAPGADTYIAVGYEYKDHNKRALVIAYNVATGTEARMHSDYYPTDIAFPVGIKGQLIEKLLGNMMLTPRIFFGGETGQGRF